MKPLLLPLIGEARTVTLIGLCKNAGKTTVLRHLMEELSEECLGLTSVGRDGERTDVVTGTEKPEIWVARGTLFATARGMLPLCDVTLSVEGITDANTPLGPVGIFRALSDGFVQLAGPSSVAQLAPLAERFRELGAKRILIDGAAGRKSLAGAEPGACAILCAGASIEGGIGSIVAETAHICRLFSAREPDSPGLHRALEEREERFALLTPEGDVLDLPVNEVGDPLLQELPRKICVLWVKGGVTGSLLRKIAQRGGPMAVAAPDATHFLTDRETSGLFFRSGGELLVRKKIRVAAVASNPWSAYGRHLAGDELLLALREALEIPVVDVWQDRVEWGGGQRK